jgi:hypothetical protein
MGEQTGQQMVGRGLRVPIATRVPAMPPVGQTTRLSVNGSTSLVVTPPLPCGLEGCVAELHITSKHGDTQRVHLNGQQRRELIFGLGGTLPLSGGLPDDALPDADERARQRAGTDR